MTVGGTIREIRKALGITQKQLAEATGIDDATIRKYESGKLNPKIETLEKIAKGLGVDVNILIDSNLDSSKAMLRLFAIYNSYSGVIKSGKDIKQDINNGVFDESKIYVTFESLMAMLNSWYSEYNSYINAITAAEHISDKEQREVYIKKAEENFHLWMIKYPSTEKQEWMSKFNKIMDEAQNYIETHPLDDPEHPLSEEDKEKTYNELNAIYKKIENI